MAEPAGSNPAEGAAASAAAPCSPPQPRPDGSESVTANPPLPAPSAEQAIPLPNKEVYTNAIGDKAALDAEAGQTTTTTPPNGKTYGEGVESGDDVERLLSSKSAKKWGSFGFRTFKNKDIEAGEAEKKSGDADKTKKDQGESVPFFSLFRYSDRVDKLLMILGTIGGALEGAALPLFTIIFGRLVNDLGSSQTGGMTDEVQHKINQNALLMLLVGIVAWVAAYLEVALWMITGERQASRIRQKFLSSLLRQEIAYFDTKVKTGEIVAKISGDTELIQTAISEQCGMFVHQIVQGCGGFLVGFLFSWRLALVMVAISPLIISSGALMGRAVTTLAKKNAKAYAAAGTVAEETLSSIRTVQSFVGSDRALKRYEEALKPSLHATQKQGLAEAFCFGWNSFIMFGANALALWYGSQLVAQGHNNGGQIITVFFGTLTAGFALGQAVPAVPKFVAGKTAGHRVFSVIERKPEIGGDDDDATGASKVLPQSVNGHLEFKGVSFTYPARPDLPILQGFDLTVNPGETVALVGESGSGKSTIVSLLERFYDPNAGEVLLDGVNIRTVPVRWLRQVVGLVSQEPVLFATTIRENIELGCPGATMAQVVAACEAANAHKFISSLPDKYETEVGERGVQLSGGQKQRIAIARAILKNPKVLLLDEATSALDNESERIVQDALDSVMVGRTTITVAHRLSTIRNANRIVVMQKGRIVEMGNHDELVALSGAYAGLLKLQEARAAEEEQEKEEILAAVAGGESGIIDAYPLSASSRKDGGSEVGVESGRRSGRAAEYPGSGRAGSGKEETLALVEKDDKDAAGEKEKPYKVPIKRVAAINKPEWPFFITGVGGAVINGMVYPCFAIIVSSLIAVYYKPIDQMTSDAQFWAIMFVVLALAVMFADLLQKFSFTYLGAWMTFRLRLITFKSLLRQEIGWFDQEGHASGALAGRLERDAALVKGAVGDTLGMLTQNLVTMIAGITVALVTVWQLALVIVAIFPLIIISGILSTVMIKGFNVEKGHDKANQIASESISNVRTVASFTMEDPMIDRYGRALEEPLRLTIKKAQWSGIGFGFSTFMRFAAYSLAFWYGAKLSKSDGYTLREITTTLFAIIFASLGIRESTLLAPDASKGKRAVGTVFKLIDRQPLIDADDPNSEEVQSVQGEVELKNVDFVYPSRPGIHVLKNFNLKIAAGTTVALVGQSGSGKSTIVGLLERFYDPINGTIYVDGKDIRTLRANSLRKFVGLVSQEPSLFGTTIKGNIEYGGEGATMDDIIAAAKVANAHNFISTLPDGYDTEVGERGVQLSGGQKQRIAIARAVLKDPRILLLDEATSALDSESERLVQEALDRLMGGRTSVVIAHRLSTVKDADNIVVMEKGSIVEQGRHAELLAANGKYSALAATREEAGKRTRSRPAPKASATQAAGAPAP